MTTRHAQIIGQPAIQPMITAICGQVGIGGMKQI
jgi:hypothetical protein